MRQKFPTSGFNPPPHMLIHNPRMLIGLHSDSNGVRFDLLRSKLDFPSWLKLQMMLFGAVLGKSGSLPNVSWPKVTD